MDYNQFKKQREEAFDEWRMDRTNGRLDNDFFDVWQKERIIKYFETERNALLLWLLENGPKDEKDSDAWADDDHRSIKNDGYNQSNQDWRTFLNGLKSN